MLKYFNIYFTIDFFYHKKKSHWLELKIHFSVNGFIPGMGKGFSTPYYTHKKGGTNPWPPKEQQRRQQPDADN